MINRKQKFLSSSFVIILLLAGPILFIIHMISDALKLKHKRLVLEPVQGFRERKRGRARNDGNSKVEKWGLLLLAIILHALILDYSLYLTWEGSLLIELHLQCDLNIWLFMLFFFFCQLLMCGTGNISVSDFRQNHSVINSGMSFGKVVKRLH